MTNILLRMRFRSSAINVKKSNVNVVCSHKEFNVNDVAMVNVTDINADRALGNVFVHM